MNEYRLVQPVHVEDGAYKAVLDSLMQKVERSVTNVFQFLLEASESVRFWRCHVSNELITLVIRLKAGAAALAKQPTRGRVGQRVTLLHICPCGPRTGLLA